MIQVHIRFFATLRDRAGVSQTAVELDSTATVETLSARLAAEYPALEAALPTALVAVNQEYAFPGNPLKDGDEVAFFPPVSGGSGDVLARELEYLSITEDELDINEITAAITAPTTGGICIFSGSVRGTTDQQDHLQHTEYLEYEAYQPMAEAKLRQIAEEIRGKFPDVQGIALVQRIGRLPVGGTTVLTACSAGHRSQGIFEAARYGIDRLKEIVPVWKKEVGPDGELWIEGHYLPTPNDVQIPTYKEAEQSGLFQMICPACGEQYPSDTDQFRCTCGEPFVFAATPAFNRDLIRDSVHSMWRYEAFLIPSGVAKLSLGEGWTPLIEVEAGDREVWLKLEGLNPSGSFKDRGASVLTSMLKSWGRATLHDDSSGNAGAALAAYAARGGLDATLYVPHYASPSKLRQIAQYGAALHAVEGARSKATEASIKASNSKTSFYASHVFQPFALIGYKTLAYELWEQLGFRVPDAVVAPLGQGSQIIGLFEGFTDLIRADEADVIPRIFGVQAEACAPLWQALYEPEASSVSEGNTLAEGIRIIKPVRTSQVLAAIKESGGAIIRVSESDITEGVRGLASRGVVAEPTSAVVWPAWEDLRDEFDRNAVIVLSITGSGLKTPDYET